MFSNFSIPKKFVGLHAHSTFSTFDGLGYPSDHIDFVLQNGMDAWALTDHGNANGLAHARSYTQKIQKSGKTYRQLYGVECYFVPSLKDWSTDYEAHKQAIKDAKTAAEAEKIAKKKVDIDADEDVDSGGLVIEDENESKSLNVMDDEWKRRYHLVVIARNRKGLANLFTMVKKSYKDGFYRYPRIDFDMLKQHGSDLIVSTACLGGIYSNRILRGVAHGQSRDQIQNELKNLTDRFHQYIGDGFHLELQFNKLEKQHVVNDYLLEHHKLTGIPLIATCDSHYPTPDKWQAREMYKQLGWLGSSTSAESLPKFEDLKCELYPKNADQMWQEFQDGWNQYEFYKGNEELVKNAIERTHDIAWQMCDDTWIDTKVKLPVTDLPNKTTMQQLTELVKDALINEGLADNPVYVDRAKEELSDIKYLGHESYFLTMYKIFKEAERHTFLGPGRGSGAGSLVNYLLGITQLDPIPYNLLWNRFLGRHRVNWPDIDTDAGNRDELIKASQKLFGEEAVIPVSNFNTLKLKSLVKDISKFYDIPYEEVNAVTGPLQDEVIYHAMDESMEKSVFVLKHEDCMAYSPRYKEFMDKYPHVEEHIRTLFAQNRSIGRHAGGVIVADPKELEETLPMVGVRGELQTPWAEGLNFRNLEDNGFLKFDFLGLTLLRDVENCIRRILKRQNKKDPSFNEIKDFFDKHLNCRFVKQDDLNVWKHVYEDGHFTGIFQFAQSGARNFAMEAKPQNIEDLAAITAIYRPGPLKANVHKKYVKAKNEAMIKSPKYAHPVIEEVLGPTYGFIAFQEQFMLLAQKLAGFSPAEGDKLRKTLVKKSVEKLDAIYKERQDAREKFIKGAKEVSNISNEIATNLWEEIDFFAQYGFNKSHAVAYAIDSYYSAWLHTHYETDWLSTILESEKGSPNGMGKAIKEIKSYGFKFNPIDINYSGEEWYYSDELKAFVPPLSSIKGTGDKATDEIMELRPYRNLDDLLFNEDGEWKHSKMNKASFNALCKMEAFGSLEEMKNGRIKNHKQLYKLIIDNYDTLHRGRYGITDAAFRKMEKKGEKPELIIDKLLQEILQDDSDWTRIEKINNQFSLSSDVQEDLLYPSELMDKLEKKNIPSALTMPEGKGIAWVCIMNDIKVKKTKNGKDFMTVSVTDNEGNIGRMKIWGVMNENEIAYTLWIAEMTMQKDWGLSTNISKMKRLTAFD